MNIRFTTFIIAIGMFLSAAALVPAWQAEAKNYTQECAELLAKQNKEIVADVCAIEEDEVSWLSWFSGKSRSAQFHFLDLFELLFDSSKSKEFNNPVR